MNAQDVTLAALREDVERVDREIVSLLARRLRLARELGALKRAAGLPLLDPQREAAIVRRAAEAAATHGVPAEPVRAIFWQIIGLCRTAQASEP